MSAMMSPSEEVESLLTNLAMLLHLIRYPFRRGQVETIKRLRHIRPLRTLTLTQRRCIIAHAEAARRHRLLSCLELVINLHLRLREQDVGLCVQCPEAALHAPPLSALPLSSQVITIGGHYLPTLSQCSLSKVWNTISIFLIK